MTIMDGNPPTHTHMVVTTNSHSRLDVEHGRMITSSSLSTSPVSNRPSHSFLSSSSSSTHHPSNTVPSAVVATATISTISPTGTTGSGSRRSHRHHNPPLATWRTNTNTNNHHHQQQQRAPPLYRRIVALIRSSCSCSTLRKKHTILLFVLFLSMIVIEVILLLRTHPWTAVTIPGSSSSSLTTTTSSSHRNNNNNMEYSLSVWNMISTTTNSNRNHIKNHSSPNDVPEEALLFQALQDCYHQRINVSNIYNNNNSKDDCPWELCPHLPYLSPNSVSYSVEDISKNNNNNNNNPHWYHGNRDSMIQHLCQNQLNHPNNTKVPSLKGKVEVIIQYQFYNPLPHTTRYICHRRIPIKGNTTVMVTSQECPELHDHPNIRSHVFQVSPIELSTGTSTVPMETLTKDQIPIELRFMMASDPQHLVPLDLFRDCDVPCRSDVPNGVVTTRYVMHTPSDPTPWMITFSMEGPQYYNSLFIDPSQYRNNHFWSTTSYDSEIPLPYYSRAEYNIFHNNYVSYDRGIKGALFMANNCNSLNDREQIVKGMIDHDGFRVDSLSSCLHNADPPNGMSLDNKIEVMKQYLFYLAFENQCVDDYITEKLWGPFEAGTIPVYFGSPNVKEHVPHHSIVHVDDYNTTHDLVLHLIEISQNRTLYESYHAWRTQPVPEHFRTKYDITDTHSTCRTCRWAYARIHGIGWNHTTQTLRPLQRIGSRQVCVSSSSVTSTSGSSTGSHEPLLVHHPFVEEWVDAKGNAVSIDPVDISTDGLQNSLASLSTSNDNGCQYPLTNMNHVIDIDHGTLRRYVYYYDGVTDFILFHNVVDRNTNHVKSPLRLRFTMSILKDPIVFRPIREKNVWHLQDSGIRYTIMVVSSSSTNPLTVQYNENDKNVVFLDLVTTPSTIPITYKIRILVEDVDAFHLNADQVENYFGQLMTDDFLYPMEMYVSVPNVLIKR